MVMTGAGRDKLGEALRLALKKKHPDLPDEALEKERAKAFRAPLVIAVGVDKPAETKVIEIENISAASAACQNILLAAHALGLGAIWRTGDGARDPDIRMALGFAPDQTIVAFLYIGYPENPLAPNERPGFAERTLWLD
jgi:nitroreductase